MSTTYAPTDRPGRPMPSVPSPRGPAQAVDRPAGQATAPDDGFWSDLAHRLIARFPDDDPELVRTAVGSTRHQFDDASVRLYLHIIAEREACLILSELTGHRPKPRVAM